MAELIDSMETEIRTTEIKTKVCAKCGLEKEIDRFYKNKSNKDGLSSYCKNCHSSYLSTFQRVKKIKIPKKRECTQATNISTPTVKPVREHKEYPPRVTPKTGEKSKSMALTFYQNCFLNGYETLLSYGLSQVAIQNIFGVSRSGIDNYGLRTKEGEEAYQRGMAELQAMMCHRMVIRALGYDYNEEKIIYDRAINKAGKPVWRKVRKEVWKKHQPCNAEMVEFFMCNKFPNEWKKSSELINKREPTYDAEPGQRNRKQVENLARNILEQNPERPETECIVQG
jgi:hypothetical protein